MESRIWFDPETVEDVLANHQLPALAVLQEALQAGYLGRSSCTANDAPNAAGFYQWNDTLRSLRENMASRGWHRNDWGNWPRTVHPDGRLAIAVSTGNQNTGRVDATPSTSRAKGPRTAYAVDINQTCFPGFEPKPKVDDADADYPTWFLLFHREKSELRSEISLPTKMGEDGHVNAWRERIILPTLPLDPEFAVIPEPDFGPDVEIKIARL